MTPRFLIKQEDPFGHKKEILELWSENLLDTPPGRLAWMMNGNPAGPAKWFFAFDSRTDELAGIISLMPKLLIYQGMVIRAGIMGDLVVAKKYRVFGPALSLVKAVINSMKKSDLAFIYTIPNPESKTLVKRAGFKAIGALLHLVKPIDLGYYLKRYQTGVIAVLPQSLLKFALKLISRDTYTFANGVKEVAPGVGKFDWSGNTTVHVKKGITSYRDPDYLKWRFFDNPLCKFRMITVNYGQYTQPKGYLFFALVDDRIHIYDLYCEEHRAGLQLIKGITRIAEQEDCVGIYIRLMDHNPFLHMFKRCGFINANDTASVLAYCNGPIEFSDWDFFSGDRNL